jgi:hypothetical protein
MKPELDQGNPQPAAADDAFVRRLQRAWGAPEMSPRERADFAASLQARLDEPRPGRARWRFFGAAFGLASAAALVVGLVLPAGRATQGSWLTMLAETQVAIDDDLAQFDGSSSGVDAERWLVAPRFDGNLDALLSADDQALAAALAPPAAPLNKRVLPKDSGGNP